MRYKNTLRQMVLLLIINLSLFTNFAFGDISFLSNDHESIQSEHYVLSPMLYLSSNSQKEFFLLCTNWSNDGEKVDSLYLNIPTPSSILNKLIADNEIDSLVSHSMILEHIKNVFDNQNAASLSQEDVYLIAKYLTYNKYSAIDKDVDLSKVFKVIEKLFKQPDYLAKDMGRELNVSVEWLRYVYSILRNSNRFQRLMLEYSPEAAFVHYYHMFLKDFNLEDLNSVRNHIRGHNLYPLALEFHPSVSCQNNCRMCMNYGNKKYPSGISNKVSEEKIISVLREAANNGLQQVLVAGGLEPLLDPLSLKIMEESAVLKIPFSVVTNGRNLNDDRLYQTLLKAEKVRVSLLSADANKYAQLTETSPDAYLQILNGIHTLVLLKNKHKASTKIGISYIVMPDNYKDIRQFLELAKELKVDFVDFRHDLLIRRRSMDETFLVSVKEQLISIKKDLNDGVFDGLDVSFSPFLNRLIAGFSISDLLNDDIYIKSPVCLAHRTRIVINPFGEVYACCQTAQPGLMRDEYYVGSINEYSNLREMLEATKNVHIPTAGCHDICSNVDKMFLNIRNNLIMDEDFGIDINEHPYSISYDVLFNKANFKQLAVDKQILSLDESI